MDTTTKLAQLLRDLRNGRMLSQRELAHLSGVDQRRISSYERGRRKVPLRDADRILAGLGLQLRLSTERLWADIDAKIDELVAAPIADRVKATRVMIPSLLHWLRTTEPIIDGCAAALLQGAPVPVEWLDLCVRREKLDVLTHLMMMRPPARWHEATQWWSYDDADPRLSGPMRWRNEMGEFRIRLVDEEPETITVSVAGTTSESTTSEGTTSEGTTSKGTTSESTTSEGTPLGGAMLRVRPLADLEFDEPETARVLSRVRERRTAKHPVEVSAERS
ncbi:MAG TPA: helix-turn-helix transcriptional regulator [Jatrophihabitantaceae bacterium]|nr:helix-turn-helix transcriptional regulator [Jatrophihabitantaceae bacterium]